MKDIINKVFINQIRKPGWLLFNMLFPIFLVVLIGFILESAFNNRASFPNVDAVVLDEGTGVVSDTMDAVSSATVSVSQDYGINLVRIFDEEEGKDAARLDGKVFIHADGEQIKVYYNESDSINGSRVSEVFSGVANSVQVVEQIYDINDDMAESILSENNAYYELPLELYRDDSYMTSFDYYGVAEITLMIMYLAMIPLSDMFRDRQTGIRNRMKMAGISDIKYYTASLLAYLMVSVIAYIPSFIVTIVAFDVNWGGSKLGAYIYLMLFAAFNLLLGMFLSVFLKTRGKVDLIIAVIILPVLSFLGGSYAPMGYTVETVMDRITLISPLRWVNLGFFASIYNQESLPLILSIIILILLSVLLFYLTVRKAGKEEIIG